MKIDSTVVLKKGKEGSIRRFHPWVFSGAIQSIKGDVKNGDWVSVTDSTGLLLGTGHYQAGTIAVRMLTFGILPNPEFWIQRIEEARATRLSTGIISQATNAYRLIHGEGDGLPGLIADVYNGVVVIQAHSAGMHYDRSAIANAIKHVLSDEVIAVYYKSMASNVESTQSEYLLGMAAAPHIIQEHGNKFYVDWEEGQKTGFFLDQRENRNLLASLSRDKTVLNTFCYTGGFSVYALLAGAQLVHSVDASSKAIEFTKKNISLNGFNPDNHECYAADTFEFFKTSRTSYDLIVLDPPAFAKHKDARHQAMKGYQRLNAEAMRKIAAGGILFTFSCSQVVDRQLFYDTVVSAAIQSGRSVKVLYHLSQPADHPVSIYHPEGEYLKGLVLQVD